MELDYEELKKIAGSVRADLTRKGIVDFSKGKIRKKPRDPEKIEMLYRRAVARVKKNKPYYDQNGKLILPYFFS
ncbi:MAG: hypothetical protein A2X59_13470 [Nitrospirae bacterium GWC2_42_7]|nr:MAG: hypothetical protein A2X59_13470 [Nitrospirae bacterium GWC2_42_7]